MIKKEKINIITTILLIGFCLACYIHFVLVGSYKIPLPFSNTFLFIPRDRFMDLFHSIDLVRDKSPYLINTDGNSYPGCYFPFSYVILWPFSFLSNSGALFVFIASFVGFFIYSVFLFAKDEKVDLTDNIRNIFVLGFLTYPFLLTIDRGNMESFLFIFEVLFVIFYLRKRFILAAFFLACAAAMKFYPIVLSIMFLGDGRRREFILCIIFAILLCIIPLFMFSGSFASNLMGFLYGLKVYSHFYVFPNHPNVNGISIIGTFKFISAIFGYEIPMNRSFFLPFVVFCIVSYLFVFYRIAKFRMSLWKRFMLLSSLTIILFNCSYDYKLISLAIAMLLFISDESSDKMSAYYSVGFGLLFIPKQILININQYMDVQVSNLFNFIIVAFFVLAILHDQKKVLNNAS